MTIYEAYNSKGECLLDAESLGKLKDRFIKLFDSGNTREPDIAYIMVWSGEDHVRLSEQLAEEVRKDLFQACDYESLPEDGMTAAKREAGY